MSRWRPPQTRSSAIISPQGYAALENELKALWRKRKTVNEALAAAAAEGDRSENAEYIYRKKEQAGIDRRIRYLQKRLPDLQIAKSVGNKDQVFFGAYVTLEKTDGSEIEYRILGPDEVDTRHNEISIDSPLAKALLKKRTDDEVSIQVGETITNYIITQIRY